jgi:hypothetical protein
MTHFEQTVEGPFRTNLVNKIGPVVSEMLKVDISIFRN